MKISKTTRWILTLGILAILLVSLGVIYGRQMAEQNRLNANIAQAHQDFVKYTRQQKDLETKLNQANSRITTLQGEFESPTISVENSDALFEAADDTSVTIIKLTSSLPKQVELNGITYQVFSISVTAEGEVEALLQFVRELSDKFSSSAINSVELQVPEKEEAEEGKEEKIPSITLGLKIYAYEVK